MISHIAAISSLLLGIAFFLTGNGLLNTLLQLRGLSEGYTTTTIGLLMSAYYGGFFIGNWVDAPIIRRIGHIRSFALFASIAAIAVLLHILLIDPWVWATLRIVYGIALIGIYMVVESWLNAQAPNSHRGRIFAVYMVANFLALATGQQLLRLDETLGFTVFAVATMAMCASLTPVMLTRRIQPTLPEKQTIGLRTLFRKAPLPLVASALSGLNTGAFWGMASVYASMKNFSTGEVATLMSMTILGGALLQYPIGRISDRFDRRRVLFTVLCASALCSAIIALPLANHWLFALFCLWGGLSFTVYPVSVAQLIDQLKPEEILAGSASLLLVNGVGAAFAPTLAGLLMQPFGANALPLYFFTVIALLAAYTFYQIRFVRNKIAEPFAQFVPMVNTSTTALEMMPDPAPGSEDNAPAASAQAAETSVATDTPAEKDQSTATPLDDDASSGPAAEKTA